MQVGFPVEEGPGKNQFTYEGYIFNVSGSSKNSFCVRRYDRSRKPAPVETSCPAVAVITRTANDGLRVLSLKNDHNHSAPAIVGGKVVQEKPDRNTMSAPSSERQQFISEQKELADARREFHKRLKEKEKIERELREQLRKEEKARSEAEALAKTLLLEQQRLRDQKFLDYLDEYRKACCLGHF